jgi:hypothetical protein
VYRRSFVEEGILVENSNNGSYISLNDSTHGTNIALDVKNSAVCFENNADVITSNAAISTSIYKGR